jgi:hypothetical protein
MKTIATFVSTLFLSLSLAACGSDGNSCDQLAKKICEGKDEATCKKTKEWLAKEMTGPDGEKLSSGESAAACKMIMDDKEVLGLYKEHALESVAQ